MNEWIAVTIERTTPQAIGVRNLKDQLVWIPRSQIADAEEELIEGVDTSIEVPEWLRKEKDLL